MKQLITSAVFSMAFLIAQAQTVDTNVASKVTAKPAGNSNGKNFVEQDSIGMGTSRSLTPPAGGSTKESHSPVLPTIPKNTTTLTNNGKLDVPRNSTKNPCQQPNPPKSCRQTRPAH
jgi:hypothetical protein